MKDFSSLGIPVIQAVALTAAALWAPTASAESAPRKPVVVRDADHAARQPFQVSLCSGTANQCGTTSDTHTVPAHRRLVIEYVSGRCPPAGFSLGNGQTFAPMLRTTAGGVAATHYFHLLPGIAIGPTQTVAALDLNGFYFAQVTRIYADPGSAVTMQIDLGGLGDNQFRCEVTVSGHTVSR